MQDRSTVLLLFNSGNAVAEITTVFERDAKSEAMFAHCVDKNDFCSDWAENGECETNPKYMIDTCPLSCKADVVKYCGVDPATLPAERKHDVEAKHVSVRDLWARADVGVFTEKWTTAPLQPHESRLVSLRYVSAQYEKFMAARTGRIRRPPGKGAATQESAVNKPRSKREEVWKRIRDQKPSQEQRIDEEEVPEVVINEIAYPTAYADFEEAVQGREPPLPHQTFFQRLTNLHSSGGVLLLENLGIVGLFLLSRQRQRRRTRYP